MSLSFAFSLLFFCCLAYEGKRSFMLLWSYPGDKRAFSLAFNISRTIHVYLYVQTCTHVRLFHESMHACMYMYVNVFIPFLFYIQGQAGITIAPLVQITRPGQIVNFTCTSDTCYDNFFVYVNDSPYVYSLSDYTYSTCTDCMESTCTFLIFTVTTQLNDTVIVCRDRYGSITDNAHLYFAGNCTRHTSVFTYMS